MGGPEGANGADAAGTGGTDPVRCTNCGRAIVTDEWHPVVTHAADEELRVFPFCDAECRDEWND